VPAKVAWLHGLLGILPQQERRGAAAWAALGAKSQLPSWWSRPGAYLPRRAFGVRNAPTSGLNRVLGWDPAGFGQRGGEAASGPFRRPWPKPTGSDWPIA